MISIRLLISFEIFDRYGTHCARVILLMPRTRSEIIRVKTPFTDSETSVFFFFGNLCAKKIKIYKPHGYLVFTDAFRKRKNDGEPTVVRSTAEIMSLSDSPIDFP